MTIRPRCRSLLPRALRLARNAAERERFPRRLDRASAELTQAERVATRDEQVRLLGGIAALQSESARRSAAAAPRNRAVDALRAAVEAALPDLPEAPVLLVRLATAHGERYEAGGDPAALREAVRAARRGAALLDDDHPQRAAVLSEAAVTMIEAGMGLQSPELFDEAIAAITAALAAGGGSPLNLAVAWRLRYEYTGDSSDLRHGLRAAGSAVAVCRGQRIAAADEYAELAQVLRYRYAATGDPRSARQAAGAARRALEETGDGAADQAATRRCLLAGALTECHQAGDPDALEEAVAHVRAALSAQPGQPRYDVAQIAAAVLTVWAGEHQDLAASAEAEHAARAAVAAAGAGDGDAAVALDTLAEVLRGRYALTGDLGVLDESITLAGQVLALPAGIPADRAGQLGNLGAARCLRYEAAGDPADLEEAIRLQREALRLVGEDHPDAPRYLGNLGLALRQRSERSGDGAALDAAVDTCRAAVDRSAAGHDRSLRLSNLGAALFARYQRFGRLADLDEEIDCQREAVRSATGGRADLPGLLNNLATALQERFDRLGGREDLAEALAAAREALDRGPRPDILATVATTHGMALHAWYEATGDRDALEAAITRLRAAVAATGASDPELPRRLANLVTSLQVASEHRPGAAQEAVEVARGALLALPEGHPDALAVSANLVLALHARGHAGDLDSAVATAEEVAARIPPGHPDAAQHLSNLAFVRHSRYLRGGDRSDRDRAVAALHSAALDEAAAPVVRLRAARSWGRLAAEAADLAEAARAFATAVELLPEAVPRRLERSDAQRWLAEFSGLAGDAAAAWLACGRPERALSLLELGRGVLLNRTLGLRGDTAAVRERNACLADRFEELRDQLDWLDRPAQPAAPDARGPVAPAGRIRGQAGGDRERRRDLVAELDTVVRRIRALPGLTGFQRPPETAELLAAAAAGPVAVVNVSTYRCDALLLSREGLRHLPLPGVDAGALDRMAGEIQQDAARSLDPRTDRSQAEAAAGRLAGHLDTLWHTAAAPVLAALGLEDGDAARGARLWWVPTRSLCRLPLHAATDAATGACAPDRAVQSYTPTVTALHHARQRRPSGRALRSAVVYSSAAHQGAAPLPAAEREVRAAARSLGAEPVDAARAGRDRLTAAIATSSHLHLALHATADADDPAGSRFGLPGEGLAFAEIAALRNNWGRLAYLSACETTRTTADLVDEAIHLTSAFQLAGFAGVIGTQWRVPDAVAEKAARRFYDELRHCGGDAARALARTVGYLRNRYTNPAAWSAHHHVGV